MGKYNKEDNEEVQSKTMENLCVDNKIGIIPPNSKAATLYLLRTRRDNTCILMYTTRCVATLPRRRKCCLKCWQLRKEEGELTNYPVNSLCSYFTVKMYIVVCIE